MSKGLEVRECGVFGGIKPSLSGAWISEVGGGETEGWKVRKYFTIMA
jgi:hypothetical protein